MGYLDTGVWNADVQSDNLKEYDAFLKTWLDYPDHVNFPWGRVEGYFDEKGVGSGICVYYGKGRT